MYVAHHPISPVPVTPRKLNGLILAAIMAFAGLIAIPAPHAVAAEHQISAGFVSWGIKASWRNYIGAAGTTLDDGVTRNAEGSFDWPIESGTFDDTSHALRLDLDGSVHFRHYPTPDGGYILDSLFKDLYVTISPSEQTIRGTYSGNPREGGDRVEIEDALLATIDIGSADFTVSGGITTWADARTFGGPDNRLYAEGTPFDPVSIEYTGPGGIPDTGEKFEDQGAPVLTPGATWLDDDATEGSRIVFASQQHNVIHVVERSGFGTAAAKYILRALNATTMEQLGSTDIEAADARQWFKADFDPATDSIFLADGDPGSTGAQIRRASYNPQDHSYSNQVIADIAPIDTSASNNVTTLVWDTSRRELIVMMNRIVAADRRYQGELTFLSAPESGITWQAEKHTISLPDAAPVTGTLTSANATNTGKTDPLGRNIAVLRDGSYVLLHAVYRQTGDTQPYATPAMQLSRHDGTISLRYITGTNPPPISSAVANNFQSAVTASDGSVLLAGYGEQYIDIVNGEAATVSDHLLGEGTNGYGYAATDEPRGLDYVMRGPQTLLTAQTRDEVVASFQFPTVARHSASSTYYPISVLPDGAVTLLVKDPESSNIAIRRFDLKGVTPKVTTSPQSQSTSLAAGVGSKNIEFTSTSTGGTGTVARQWQAKPIGQSSYTDIAGETAESLTVAAKPGMDGTQYRAVYTNDAGKVVSEVATLSVDFAPVMASDARDQSVTEGQDAVFVTSFDAFPEAAYQWQRRVNGFWTNIASDDDVTVNGPSLTVRHTDTEQSGTQFRVKASNDVGTTISRAARLTVNAKVTPPQEGLELNGVSLEWEGSTELQKTPPYGGSNFFSAGISDGSETTYRSSHGSVSVLHVGTDGNKTPASWATRARQTTGDVTQRIRLTDGQAHLNKDGSATVSWDGSWSANFYGGLVPFSFTDPELTVDSDGTGTLKADLSGYASSQEDPNTRTPLPPVAEVTVATFRDADIDPTGKITITPDYAGVAIDVPSAHTAQNRSSAGWGAWPQEFVDFHFATGLSSYWYSSGGTADPLKPPSPLMVDFTDAVSSTPQVDASSVTTAVLARSSHPYGARTTVTVRVAAAGKRVDGPVQVKVNGASTTATLTNGSAVVAMPKNLRPGRYQVQATFAGRTGIKASRAHSTLTVTKAVVTISHKLHRSTIKKSQRGKVIVTVKIPGGQGARPTGQIVIRDGSRIVAVKTLRTSHRGKLTVTLPKLSRGKHYLRVSIGSTPVSSPRTSAYKALRVK